MQLRQTFWMAGLARSGKLAGTLAGGLVFASLWAIAAAEPMKPAHVFQGTNLWTVRLRFAPEQWEAMEPKVNPSFGGPGRFMAGGFGGADAARPLVLLSRGFFQGDSNQDGTLSREEFARLGEKWFAAWDPNHTDMLTADQLRAGLVATFNLPDANRPRRSLLGAEVQHNGLAAASGIEFEYVHADLDFAGRSFTNVAVRYKGNGTFMQSRNSLKRSLKIELNQYVKGQKLAGLTKLNLHNCVTDASWMNEVLSHRLLHGAGVPAPRTAYACVFITVPGKFEAQYFGLYSLVEDLDKHFAEERFGTKEGTIFKPVLRPAVQEESELKLARFDKVVAGEPVEPLTLRAGLGNGRRGPAELPQPIKTFVKDRARSVQDQLAGNSSGEAIENFGFGGFANRGGGRFRGADGAGPGALLQRAILNAFDANQDGKLSHEKLTRGFAKWFEAWNTDKSGQLTEQQVQLGLVRELPAGRGTRRGGEQ
jgi:hypothetical protein